MEALTYLLKVGIIYTFLYLIYHGLMRRNTHFYINRFYLLAIVPISYLLPFAGTLIPADSTYQIVLPLNEVLATNTNLPEMKDEGNPLMLIYFFATALLIARMFIRIYKVLRIIYLTKNNQENDFLPFSFFNYIYIPSNIETEDREAILQHEQIHAAQLHSLDVIIYEINAALLWWNPLVWMGSRAAKINHEYIADQSAIVHSKNYSSVLVAQLLGVNCSELVNNFNNQSLLKKRIDMMKMNRTKSIHAWKATLALPVIAIALMASTSNGPKYKEVNTFLSEKTDGDVYDKVDVMPEFKGGMTALVNYLSTNLKYPEKAKNEGASGKVVVKFVVDKKGNVKDVGISKSVESTLDAEAVRVVESMPRWNPGVQDGKKVNVQLQLPIMFQL